MPGTFSQIYIQIIFAVKGRRPLIKDIWEDELYMYITGIVQNYGQKMLAINGMSDHIHIFIGMKPSCCISDLVREIKKASNRFIREREFTRYHFDWQNGYASFSYSYSALNDVIKYIMNQKEHHKQVSFKMEYEKFIKDFNVDYRHEFLFD